MTPKHLNRKIRVLRLLVVVQAYHHYTMMQLNRQLLQHDNSWQDAEHLSHWSKVLMPWKESSPKDFLHDKDEVSDEVLNNYDEFKKWVKTAEKVGISENSVVEYSLFTGKVKPSNLAEFRKTVLEIEKNIMQITNKQTCRNVEKQYSEKIDTFTLQEKI